MAKDRATITIRGDLLHETDRLAGYLNISRSELISRILELTVPAFVRRDVSSVTMMTSALINSWGREHQA